MPEIFKTEVEKWRPIDWQDRIVFPGGHKYDEVIYNDEVWLACRDAMHGFCIGKYVKNKYTLDYRIKPKAGVYLGDSIEEAWLKMSVMSDVSEDVQVLVPLHMFYVAYEVTRENLMWAMPIETWIEKHGKD